MRGEERFDDTRRKSFFFFLSASFVFQFSRSKKRKELLSVYSFFLNKEKDFFDNKMANGTQITLRTRHINCSYCIALSFFLLSIILFALSSKESNALGNQQSRTPVIISASILLVLAVLIVILNTYYAVGYFRMKKHEELNRSKDISRPTSADASKISVVVFDNATFTMNDPSATDTPTNIQMSA